MKDLLSELTECGFDPYLTSVGGSGLGILSPYPEHRNTSAKDIHPGQVTPPETPDEANTTDPGDSIKASFETKSLSELTGWAQNLGKWLYV